MLCRAIFLLISIVLPHSCDYRRYLNLHKQQKTLGDRFYFERNLDIREDQPDPKIQRLIDMCEEVLKSARMKMLHVREMRQKYELMVGFNIGLIVGAIDENYKTMMEIYEEALEFNKTASDTSANEDDSVHDTPSAENSTYFNNLIGYLSYIHAQEKTINVYTNVLEIIPETEFSKTYINETTSTTTVHHNGTAKIDMNKEYNKIIHEALMELQYSNKTAYLEVMKQFELVGRDIIIMKELKEVEANKSMNKEYIKEIHFNETISKKKLKKDKPKNVKELKEVERNITLYKELKELELNRTMNNELEAIVQNRTDANIGELKEEHNKTEKEKHIRRRTRRIKSGGGLSLTFFPMI